MDLKTFLLARIDEDEAVARDAVGDEGGRWHVDQSHEMWAPEVRGDIHIYDEGGHTAEQALHIARHDPARALAECAAKRAIVEQHEFSANAAGQQVGIAFVGARAAQEVLSGALKTLAAVYADHPDYQPEWKL